MLEHGFPSGVEYCCGCELDAIARHQQCVGGVEAVMTWPLKRERVLSTRCHGWVSKLRNLCAMHEADLERRGAVLYSLLLLRELQVGF